MKDKINTIKCVGMGRKPKTTGPTARNNPEAFKQVLTRMEVDGWRALRMLAVERDKLIVAYMTTGTNDAVLISEVADGSDAVAAGMAAAASGALAKVETVRAWTLAEFKGIAEKAGRFAGAYKPPGK